MANPTNSLSLDEVTFAPRELVPVPVGKHQARLYPTIDSTMPVHERAHAFHINLTAIKNVPGDLSVQLDAFGAQLNASASVKGNKANYFHYLYN